MLPLTALSEDTTGYRLQSLCIEFANCRVDAICDVRRATSFEQSSLPTPNALMQGLSSYPTDLKIKQAREINSNLTMT
jgi:hypothetical protein